MILFLFFFQVRQLFFSALEETKFESPLRQITIHQFGKVVLNSCCHVHSCLTKAVTYDERPKMKRDA